MPGETQKHRLALEAGQQNSDTYYAPFSMNAGVNAGVCLINGMVLLKRDGALRCN